MATVGTLTANLVAETASFQRDLGKAQRVMNSSSAKMNRALGGLDRGFAQVQRQAKAFGVAIAAAATAGLVALAKRSLDTADAIAKTSRNLGLTTDQLQEFRHAAELSGVGTKTLESSMLAFVKRVGEAKAGVGPLVSGLKALDGELLADIKSAGSQEEALVLVADAMANAESATDRARIANAAFSRAGISMVEMLRGGKEGFAGMRKEAHELGAVIDAKLFTSAEKTKDELARLEAVISADVTSAVLNLTGPIIAITGHLADWGKTAKWVTDRLNDLFSTSKVERQAQILDEIAALDDRMKMAKITAERAGSENSAGFLKRLQLLKDEVAALNDEWIKLSESMKTAPTPPPPATGAAGGGVKTETKPGKGYVFDSQAWVEEKAKAWAAAREAETAKAAALAATTTEMERQNDQLARMIVSQGQGTKAVKAMTEIQEIENMALADGVDLTSKQSDAWYAAARKGQMYKAEIERVAKAQAEAKEVGDAFGNTIAGAFEEAILSGKRFSDVLKGLAMDLAKLVLRKAVTEPLAAGLSGVFTNIFGGLFKAEGGPVHAGQPYIVGEKRPELFVPGQSGTILPSVPTDFGGGGGGGLTINQQVNVTNGIVPLVQAEVHKMLPMIKRETVGAVTEARARNAGVRRAFA